MSNMIVRSSSQGISTKLTELKMVRFETIKNRNYYKIRSKDFITIFKNVPYNYFNSALELGTGDGFQSAILARYSRKLVSTDISQEKLPRDAYRNITYKLCDAEDLSQFKNKTFNMIYSSNLLEHVGNKKKCITEMKRVLKEDGIMVHVMPNRIWKIANMLFHVITHPFSPRPQIHGSYKNHIEEFLALGKSIWITLFKNNGLYVNSIIKLSFSCHYYNISFLRDLANLFGIPTSYAYILTKTSKNIHLKYFQPENVKA